VNTGLGVINKMKEQIIMYTGRGLLKGKVIQVTDNRKPTKMKVVKICPFLGQEDCITCPEEDYTNYESCPMYQGRTVESLRFQRWAPGEIKCEE